MEVPNWYNLTILHIQVITNAVVSTRNGISKSSKYVSQQYNVMMKWRSIKNQKEVHPQKIKVRIRRRNSRRRKIK